jgi:anti-sigma B factor antagonist
MEVRKRQQEGLTMSDSKTGTVFQFDAERNGSCTLVTLRGDLDVASAWRLREALTVAQESDAEEMIVDLAEVEFIDSSCLGVLVRASAACKKQARRFVLQGPSRAVVLALAASGLVRTFDYDKKTLADSATGLWPSRLPAVPARRRSPHVVRLGA